MIDFAEKIRDLLEIRYSHVEKVVLVFDNLNTHKPAALYQAFEPTVAHALIGRLVIHPQLDFSYFYGAWKSASGDHEAFSPTQEGCPWECCLLT